ncbi:MAG: radical SAM family heme chaperone HemW [Candidatus Dormibacteraceae bacterium]
MITSSRPQTARGAEETAKRPTSLLEGAGSPAPTRPDPGSDRLRPFSQLYLHIPFCKHKCGYCDFNAYAGMSGLMRDYVEALLIELEEASRRFRFAPLESVYLGGGTPSLLPPELISRLLAGVRARFALAPNAEVTLEANPASTDPEKLSTWLERGVNRLSLGVQSFDRSALGVLERRSDGRVAEKAFKDARGQGFGNISIDLIYAVPSQTERSWGATLTRALALGADHISAYALTFEAGTLLERRRREGMIEEVPEDLQWDLLDVLVDRLAVAGYERYEVSSFAREGFRSRHNQGYWRCRPCYGAGAGAHSYTTDGSRSWRWWNLAHPRRYIASAPDPIADGEKLERDRADAEKLMLGLRWIAGVRPAPGFGLRLLELERLGLIERSGDLVAPTRRGLDLHNQIALAVL